MRHVIASEGLGRMPQAEARAWAWAVVYIYLATVLGATAVIVQARASVGIAPDLDRVFLWQMLRWGMWLPIGWFIWQLFLVRPFSFALPLFACAGLAAAPAQVLASALLAKNFSSARSSSLGITALLGELPVALLVYTALGAIGIAAAARARAAQEADLASNLAKALEEARQATASPVYPELDMLMVSSGSRKLPVPANLVEWFGSAGNYVVVNWSNREGLVRDTLAALETRLDPAIFARSHRTTIVNLSRVHEATSLSDGSWRLLMESGAELVASRTYRDEVLRRLGRR